MLSSASRLQMFARDRPGSAARLRLFKNPMKCQSSSRRRLNNLTSSSSDEKVPRRFNQRVMEYSLVKDALRGCPLFQGLDESAMAYLFWRAEEVTSVRGSVIYVEGAPCDNSFGLLLRGKLDFSQGGAAIRSADGIYVFGEVGFFEQSAKRAATVKVSSASATYLRFRIGRDELKRDPLKELDRRLGTEAVRKVVENT
jgi:hypothetical protein